MRDSESEQRVSKLLDELERLRRSKNLSHEKLAQLAGISRSTVGLLESKKRTPTILTCLKLCRALGVRLEDLLRKIQ
jgi:DNA-binding XRE family transcriptional regulator